MMDERVLAVAAGLWARIQDLGPEDAQEAIKEAIVEAWMPVVEAAAANAAYRTWRFFQIPRSTDQEEMVKIIARQLHKPPRIRWDY